MAGDKASNPAAQQAAQASQKNETEIIAPVVFWIVMLIVGVLIELFLIPLANYMKMPQAAAIVREVAFGIIYFPGSLVFSMLTALWIGLRVGNERKKVLKSAQSGAINALFTALVYVISIVIIYLILLYANPAFISAVDVTAFLLMVVTLPLAILIVLVPLVAALAAARHY